jgi:hypothetical protein
MESDVMTEWGIHMGGGVSCVVSHASIRAAVAGAWRADATHQSIRRLLLPPDGGNILIVWQTLLKPRNFSMHKLWLNPRSVLWSFNSQRMSYNY